MALRDPADCPPVAADISLKIEVNRPVIGSALSVEDARGVRALLDPEGDEAVFVRVFGLVDHPVEMVWMAWLFV